VIVATGGLPNLDWLDGAELCTSVWDALSGAATLGDSVIVYDGTGRHAAPTVAERAKQAGRSVEYIMLDDVPAKELTYAERVIWKKRFAEEGIEPFREYGPPAVERSGNMLTAAFVHELTGETLRLEADTVVVETGTVPADGVFRDLRASAANDGIMDFNALTRGMPQPAPNAEGFILFRIGDALSSRDVAAAMFDALRLCSRL
jgi:hypothetical protein